VYLPPISQTNSYWRGPMRKGSAQRDMQERLQWARKVTEVAHRFASDPEGCLKDRRAQRILRSYEHPYRFWYGKPLSSSSREGVVKLHLQKNPGQTEQDVKRRLDRHEFETKAKPLIERQQIPFWRDLCERLCELELPLGLEKKFTDYLTGYLLVLDLQQEQSGKMWRALKRSSALREIGISPSMAITAAPPHKERLKTRIIVLMTQELAKHGWSQRREIYDRFVIPTWETIGVAIRKVSVLRQVRRSRQKGKRTPH